MYRRSGIDGVVAQAIRHMRRLPDFANAKMEAASAHFHYERWAYARLDVAATVTKEQVAAWAMQPV